MERVAGLLQDSCLLCGKARWRALGQGRQLINECMIIAYRLQARDPMIRPVVTGLSVLAIALAAEAVAQERGTLNPQPLPPLADPADPNTPAKELFARKPEPVHLAARAIGNYVRGCLAGAAIWLTPMPDHALSRKEREEMSATNVVAADRTEVDPRVWTPAHVAVIRAAAEDRAVERIFVNAAIKKALCQDSGSNSAWLHKVRPWWHHDYHFHVRIHCPAGNPHCHGQPPPSPDDGCGKELDWWFTDAVLHPKPEQVPVKDRWLFAGADLALVDHLSNVE